MSDGIDHLITECVRIEEFAQANSATHFEMAKNAHTLSSWLGAVPIVVSGAVGAVVLSDASFLETGSGRLAGAIAIAAAGAISSILAWVNPDQRRMLHEQAGDRYKRLENEARRAYQIYAKEESRESFMLRVTELTRRYDELGDLSPQTDNAAYQRAIRRVQSGTFNSDRS